MLHIDNSYISSVQTKLKQIYRFSTLFSRDADSMPRVWTGKEDIKAITKTARSAVRQMLIFNTVYMKQQGIVLGTEAYSFSNFAAVHEVAFYNGCNSVGGGW